jgi:hypothetical protein
MTMRDFTRERKKIEFQVDDDVFTAKSPIPAQTLIDFAATFSGLSTASSVVEQLRAFNSVLELVLMPASLEVFRRRMDDPEEPIAIDQVEEIITWLFEEYGLRPTELPSDSSDGQVSLESGTSSTESTPDVVSISLDSPSTSF